MVGALVGQRGVPRGAPTSVRDAAVQSWKTRIVRFGFAKRQRLGGVAGTVPVGRLVRVVGGEAGGGGVGVPERGILLGVGVLEPLLSGFALVLGQQSVETFPPPQHCPPLA